MMTDRQVDIDLALGILMEALRDDAQGEEVSLDEVYGPLTVLLGGVLIDLNRIANTVEKLMQSNPDPTKPMSLRDLTEGEKHVVEALRKGDLKVIPYSTDRAWVGGEFKYGQ